LNDASGVDSILRTSTQLFSTLLLVAFLLAILF
jgi:hypothetical protein